MMVSKRVDLEGRQRGNGIKIVAYAPGCKIQRIDLALPKTSTVGEEFVCHGLPNVTLAGQIKPVEMPHVENGQLAGFGNLGGVGSGCLALRHQFAALMVHFAITGDGVGCRA